MNKIREFKFTKDVLLLVLCVVGTAAVAWWAWTAGPVESHSALGSTPQTETSQGLGPSPYGSAIQAGTAAGSSGYGQSAGPVSTAPSGNISSSASPPANVAPEPDVLYPIDPSPKCNYYKYPGSAQPNTLYCPVCETYQSPQGGIRYPCGCGGTETLCASPL